MGIPFTSTSRDRVTSRNAPPRVADELGFESILYEKAPPRATITLNRPEVLNAFDFRMLRELARACEDASWDDEIRVVVLTGAGRAFCVGANLRAWADEGLVGNEREYWKWFGAMDARRHRAAARSASRRSRGSTGSASAAATSCRWRATSR